MLQPPCSLGSPHRPIGAYQKRMQLVLLLLASHALSCTLLSHAHQLFCRQCTSNPCRARWHCTFAQRAQLALLLLTKRSYSVCLGICQHHQLL